MTRLRTVALGLSLSAGSIVVCLAAAELSLRAFHPVTFRLRPASMPDDAFNHTFNQLLHRRSSIPGLPYELAPNTRKVAVGAMVETNSYGMRGPEPVLDQSGALYRIVALGDSFTFGFGVSGEDTYPSVLARLLNARPDLNHRFDVLNLGVAGYCSRDEALLFKHKGLQWNPRLLIIGYVLNDPEIDPMQPLQAYFQTPVWWQYFNLGRLVAHATFASDVQRLGHGDYHFYLHAEHQRKWQSVLTAFQDIAEMTAPRHVQVLVVIFPEIPLNRPNFSWAQYQYQPIHRQVADAATRNGFAVLDLLEPFAQYPPQELILSIQDTHPNKRADELAAQAIFDKLVAERASLF
jgi:lysophospholipase L1-like esterase